MDNSDLVAKAGRLFGASLVVLALVFFVPAGTLDYWQAWAYMAVVLVPAAFVVSYFLKRDPEFLRRRLKLKEKEASERSLIKLSSIVFAIAFLVPGLDRRFGWSSVPWEIVLVSDALVFLGYLLVFLVFKENSFAGRTIEVVKGQKVISTGPYAIVRHPMYVGVILMYTATPIALGSYWALPLFLLLIPVIIYRIFDEERVLKRELSGYQAYCEKTRYRLVPFVW